MIVDAIAGLVAGIPGEAGAKAYVILLVVCILIIAVILLTH
jgi:hypothetical protein